MRQLIPLGLAIAVTAVAVLRVMELWGQLPPTMASHYGASGQPNGWMSRDGFFWFYALFGGGTAAVMFAVAPIMGRMPTSLINIPNKDHWLTPERKQETMARMQRWISWYGFLITLFLYAILELVLYSNVQREPLNNFAFLTVMIAFLAITAVWAVMLFRAFRVPTADR